MRGRTAPPDTEVAPGFAAFGVEAFTTTRARGSFALHAAEPAGEVIGRWEALANDLLPLGRRLAVARQVHGDAILEHHPGWEGWLRGGDADAHIAWTPGTAMAVTIADCVPVFVAHPRGACAVVHSGWKGTVARITRRVIERFREMGFAPAELLLHCGPAICGRCYEVSPDVYGRLTGRAVAAPTPVDLRALIAADARGAGVPDVTVSDWCTRCHNTRFFSHRCGDGGRQLGVIVAGGSRLR